ncbi:hypothetical protein [Cylindrospermum sp. FACHB-282]|uniref:hypothetical protein n=1 Tax=Cylindrospermum sp. FACHB-282 TaxID=2692794 RepID=UPI001A7EFB1E|nr:hypothetical protein [Cylindrospermum sp. FACHB-282]
MITRQRGFLFLIILPKMRKNAMPGLGLAIALVTSKTTESFAFLVTKTTYQIIC